MDDIIINTMRIVGIVTRHVDVRLVMMDISLAMMNTNPLRG
jgi:hypothetical protein